LYPTDLVWCVMLGVERATEGQGAMDCMVGSTRVMTLVMFESLTMIERTGIKASSGEFDEG